MSEYQILSKIECPEDLKNLTHKELTLLSSEIRDFLIQNISKTGGHFASNLGVVELTIALHKVFNSPQDKFIFDVGHQCYPHKLLTGRRDKFHTNRQYGGLSGFTRRYESEHDFVDAGHASTSISSALGIFLGEELQGKFNYIIPVIGDASLTGGMSYEAMNHLGHIHKKMIVILNDNNMSIDGNVGAMSSNLSKLTTTKGYQKFRRFADYVMLHIPFIGKQFYSAVMRWKKSVKTLFYKSNIFTDLGLKYIGPIDGHDLYELEKVLNQVKLLSEPVLIHVITKKGKGYKPAEDTPEKYHGVKPFDPDKGVVSSPSNKITYTQAFGDALLKAAKKDEKIVAITAAMMSGTGLTPFFNEFPKRSFDVGITEEHAVTMAAGMAITGIKPVVAIYSTFIQRSIDQILHDVSIANHPVIFALDRAGIVPADGEAHQGLFDISLLKTVPGMTILAPSTVKEMEMMLDYALTLDGPSTIRYAKDVVVEEMPELDRELVLGQGVTFESGSYDTLIISYGELVREALGAAELLREREKPTSVYSMRFISPFNEKEMRDLIKSYKMVIVMEDAIIKGGVAEEIRALNSFDTSIYTVGVNASFLTHGTRPELKKLCNLDATSLADFVIEKSEEVRHKEVVERIKNRW